MSIPLYAIDPASENPEDVISYPYPNKFGPRVNFLDILREAQRRLENMDSGVQLNFLAVLDASLEE